MTSRIACAALLACPLVLGCGGLFRIGTRNLCNEAKLIHDDHMERLRYCRLAHDAWDSVQAHCPGRAYSEHYAVGFKDGFVDYLYAGGCGEPPALPPKCYRHFHGESAQGVQALQDWYAGFRHGAAVARESGQRQFVVVSLPPPPGAPPPPPPVLLGGAPIGAMPSPTWPPTLPTPRQVPAEVPPRARERTSGEGTPEMPAPSNEAPPPTEQSTSSEEPAKKGPAIEKEPSPPQSVSLGSAPSGAMPTPTLRQVPAEVPPSAHEGTSGEGTPEMPAPSNEAPPPTEQSTSSEEPTKEGPPIENEPSQLPSREEQP